MSDEPGDQGRGRILFTPSAASIRTSRLAHFAAHVERTRGRRFQTYQELQRWSVSDLEEFWTAIAEFFEVEFETARSGPVVSSHEPLGARWFEGAFLNYAAHALRRVEGIALLHRSEKGRRRELTFAELREAVARCRAGLRRLGVERGDRVVGVVPNTPEAVIAFLATASLGAIWSSCPPEFGADSVLDRFRPVAPKVLLAVDAYEYGGRRHSRAADLETIRNGLPSLAATVVLLSDTAVTRPVDRSAARALSFDELLQAEPEPGFEPVPFGHPLWILYSSGTTGSPKAIVQSHGGILLEHYKTLGLHHDLGPDDRFFWFSTTGWMMWNYLVSGLLLGSTVVLYDGSPAHPDLRALWRLAEEERVTYFGTSAPFISTCRARGIEPKRDFPLKSLRGIGSTGAPLPNEGFEWIYEAVKSDVHLGSVSGGTDVCTAFLLCCPWLPVRSGELQCSALGAAIEAYDDGGRPLLDQVGELVVERPMPSMPTQFWNDDQGELLRSSYYERFPGVWHHGDWLRRFEDGGAVIYGRSDATLKRGGVRMGTSEFYRVVEDVEGVKDSLVVDTTSLDQPGRLWLFVVLDGTSPREDVVRRLKLELKQRLSPRHVPDLVCDVPDIPYTLSGKKLEVPVKRLLMGMSDNVNRGTLRNPTSLDELLARAAACQDVR